ncbi:hypothetical protein KK062_29625 [Fulvivirgaceae bacterium PWU5]|uniref:TonB C-terminal domain-containing protein n=1 Tax=Dawidia cretensis TaxID=2782350 RepID=A0AAP2GWG2_9BACT|nr:hypothetical protein [Dawidia cretensis]MBT1712438.1 hypothetical protein [Dawidia cretensis]
MKISLSFSSASGITSSLVVILCFASSITYAQDRLPAGCDSLRMVAEVMPVYKKGLEDFIRDFRKDMKLPHGCHPDKIVLKCVVDKTGKLSNIEIAADSTDDKCREGLIRSLESLPAWTPGRHKGKPVCVRMVMPMYVHYTETTWNDD